MKYRKKPVVIEAWQNQSGPVDLMPGWVRLRAEGLPGEALTIMTLEGNMRADPWDWIIQGVKGEVYPCKPDIFEATYERVDE